MATKPVTEALEVGTFDYEWGKWYYTPKELWNFKRQGRVTDSPETVAREFLKANYLLFGLQRNLTSLKHDVTTRGLAGYHVIFRQYMGRGKHRSPISGGIVSVHMTNRRLVYMCKNRSMPYYRALEQAKDTKQDYILPQRTARKVARDLLKDPQAEALEGFARVKRTNVKIRESNQIWWTRAQGQVMSAAWKVRLTVESPVEEWNIVVSAPYKGHIEFLEITNNGVSYASPYRFTGKACLFKPNPAVHAGYQNLLKDCSSFLQPEQDNDTYRDRLKPVPEDFYYPVKLKGLDDSGYLNGKRVTIKVPPNKKRQHHPKRDFSMIRSRLPGSRKPTGFEELMVYHYTDRVIAYLEKLGYKNKRAIFKKALVANVYWTNVDGSAYDGAWYNHPDQQLCFGEGQISDAEDGETIVHEVGHAIQDHIVNNFGQSEEAGAMGEGFSDYLAMSYFKTSKPAEYQKTVMSWDGLITGLTYDIDPPCQRHIHSSFYGELTYNNFVIGEDAWKHTNGLIWTATLWDIQEALGREIADKIIIESHFELSPHTNMPRGARAIIHADRHLYRGKHEEELEKIFEARGFPPYAYGQPTFRKQVDYEFEQPIVEYAHKYPSHKETRAANNLALTEMRRPTRPLQLAVGPNRVKAIWKRYGIQHPVNLKIEVHHNDEWKTAKVIQQQYNQVCVRLDADPRARPIWIARTNTRPINEE